MSTPGPGPRARARVAQLCTELSPHVDEPETLTAASRALSEPLRLAVVGRVSTGKSTLVNALVGRRVAPTSAGECTRVVTWYRFGAPARASLHLRDGTVRPLRLLEDDQLPVDLDVPAEAVDRIEVQLTSSPLRSLTLIDTPGLDSLTTTSGAATERAVLGRSEESTRAAGDADALLYLIADAARRSDLDFLDDFHAAAGSLATSAANAIGVLSRADTFSSGPLDPTDPFETAARLAQGMVDAHPTELADVVPVSGLLAESARTGVISEGVAMRLSRLAEEDDLALRLRLEAPDVVDVARLLGPYGVVHGRHHATQGAGALKQWCTQVSGMSRLESVLSSRLVPRADLLKAAHALALAQRVAQRVTDPDVRDTALSLVEAARLGPELHAVDELRVLQALRRTHPDSPLVAQLHALLEGDVATALGDPGPDPVSAAHRRSAEATSTAALAMSRTEAEAARVLARSYYLLSRTLSSGEAP